MSETITIGGRSIEAGAVRRIEIPMARMPSGGTMALPVTVVRGTADGPVLWISAAIHGDELNGAEIITEVLEQLSPSNLAGTVIAVPIVNVFGFVGRERYFPDRRDLNRSFPGSPDGSLAAQVANLFMTEVVEHATHGIDLHTGSQYRCNYPHIRTTLSDPALREFGIAFGAGMILDSQTPRGSLRESAAKRGIPCIVFEGGEANRFDPLTIRIGTAGVLRAMKHLGMIDIETAEPASVIECHETRWVRARRSGIFRPSVNLGDAVRSGALLGTITDSFGEAGTRIKSPRGGIVLGLNLSPIVYRGDAIAHIAFPEG